MVKLNKKDFNEKIFSRINNLISDYELIKEGELIAVALSGWQYVMYSGGCYQDDTYHIGYAAAKTTEQDLTQVEYTKATDNGKFLPVLIKNEIEEGTGHHSVIRLGNSFYAIYHARDYDADKTREARTARVCQLLVADGVILAKRI